MELTEAEYKEFELDDLLAGSLPHEGAERIVVHAEDAELRFLLANHTMRWKVLTGPQTLVIVAVLELGPSFHLAWAVSDEEEAPLQSRLASGARLPITITSPTQGSLELTAPPLPAALRPQLTTPYLPVNAA